MEADCLADDDATRASPSPLSVAASSSTSVPSPSPIPDNLVATPSVLPNTAESPLPSAKPSSLSGSKTQLPCSVNKKRKQTDQVDDVISIALEKLASYSTPDRKRTCLDFAIVICNELEDMTVLQRKLAKKLIMDVIFLGSMETLTLEHLVMKGNINNLE